MHPVNTCPALPRLHPATKRNYTIGRDWTRMPPSSNKRGILAMLAASCCFISNDTLMKLASVTYPTGQIMAVRGAFAVLIALAFVAAFGHLRALACLAQPMVLLRAALEAAVAFLFITSLAHLPIADITAILQSTPILMTLMAVAMGLERVGWRRWTAIAVGFLGVLLIVKPSPLGLNAYALLAVAAAVLVAARDLVTRAIGVQVPSPVVALATTGAVGLAGAVAGVRESWGPLGGPELVYLVGAAVFVSLGNIAIVVAFRGTDVSVVSPFRYCVIPLAIIFGVLVFGELPDLWAAAGIALIGASGVYTIHREQVRLRQQALAAAPRLGHQQAA